MQSYFGDLEKYQLCTYARSNAFFASFNFTLCLLERNPYGDCHSAQECAEALRSAMMDCTSAVDIGLADVEACVQSDECATLIAAAQARTSEVFPESVIEPAIVLDGILDTTTPSSQELIEELCNSGISAAVCHARYV